MDPELIAFLALRFGRREAPAIARRWRARHGAGAGQAAGMRWRNPEYDDLLALLLEYAQGSDAPCVARWIARSCLGADHLWEDLGLPDRPALTALMADCFPRLRALNSANMRWKKFLYRQLCERAQIHLCRAPSCAQCTEYAQCFETPPLAAPAGREPRAVPAAARPAALAL